MRPEPKRPEARRLDAKRRKERKAAAARALEVAEAKAETAKLLHEMMDPYWSFRFARKFK